MQKLKFCPICGSMDVNWRGGLAILNPHMECMECGHKGLFIIGDFDLAKKLREEYLASNR